MGPVDMAKYERVSGEIFKVLYEFTPAIEPISIDEAFMDITESYKIFGSPLKTCALIKERIKKVTGLTASLGMAPVKMVAKIASDLRKPDGFVEVKPGKVREFLNPLPIRKLWGLGEKSELVLNRMGIKTIGELARMDETKLVNALGENGRHLLALSQGIDPREVVTEHEAKSVGKEFTFDVDTLDKKKIEATLMLLCEKVSTNLREQNLKGRTITLKIRLEGFETYTRAITIAEPTNFEDEIFREIKKLYTDFDTKGKKIRLLGVKASHFGEAGIQANLFEKPNRKKEELHKALDAIKKKFGSDAVHRATVIKDKD
jgi:DNA polymerase-4